MNEQESYPVKYMPVVRFDGSYDILDTSFEGQGCIVCTVYTDNLAFSITKYLNECEGFVYEPQIL